MSWGRLALFHAVGEEQIELQQFAGLFGYAVKPEIGENRVEEFHPEKTSAKHEKPKQGKLGRKKKSALFIRVNGIQQLQAPDDILPDYLIKESTKPDQASKAGWLFEAPKTGLNKATLWPLLINVLGKLSPSKRIDHRTLISKLANAQIPRKIPYHKTRRWPVNLTVLVDTQAHLAPVQGDFLYIVQSLQRLLGQENVDAICFERELGSRTAPWPKIASSAWKPWRLPPVSQPIMILSDLGQSTANTKARRRWNQFAGLFKNHRTLTLNPSPEIDDQCCSNQILHSQQLTESRHVSRHFKPARNSLTNRLNQDIESLMAYLAPLPLIDTGLLRKIRSKFVHSDLPLDLMLWNHHLIRREKLFCTLDRSKAGSDFYLKQNKQLAKADSKQIWRIVRKRHKHAFPGLVALEEINKGIQLQQKTDGSRDYIKTLLGSNYQGLDKETFHPEQLQTYLQFIPESVWRDTELPDRKLYYTLYAVANRQQLLSKKGLVLPAGFDQNQIDWLFKDKNAQTVLAHWQVQQINAQGGLRLIKTSEYQNSSLQQIDQWENNSPLIEMDGKQQTYVENKIIHLAESKTLSISGRYQRLTLEAISRPAWASKLSYENNWLYVQTQAGNSPKYYWHPEEISENNESKRGIWFPQLDIEKITKSTTQNPSSLFSPESFNRLRDQYGIFYDIVFNDVIQRFRWIEPGHFMMGSPEDEAGRLDRETLHQVTLTEGFWLGETTVTQDLWFAVMKENPSRFEGKQLPVEQISWDDAQEFIQKLNEKLVVLKAQLPTEAQWEYACRAGTISPFSFGENIRPEQVNYDGEYPYADGKKGEFRNKTVEVKSLPANPWGLHEMHGNVWEWCQDWYGEYPNESVTDPTGPERGVDRVLRGGSWIGGSRRCRSAQRVGDEAGERFDFIGFRLSLGHEQSQLAQQQAYRQTVPTRRGAAAARADVKPASVINKLKKWIEK